MSSLNSSSNSSSNSNSNSSSNSSSYSSTDSNTSSGETVIEVPRELLNDEKYAKSGIEILDIEDFKEKYTNGEEDEDLKFTFEATWNTICKNQVNVDFAKGSLDNFTYAIIARDINSKSNKSIRGFCFCTLKTDDKGVDYIYLDIVCRAPSHTMQLRNMKYNPSGKDMIMTVFDIARELRCEYVKLSALTDVITYYYKVYGFRFIKKCGDKENCSIQNKIRQLISEKVKNNVAIKYDDLGREIKKYVTAEIYNLRDMQSYCSMEGDHDESLENFKAERENEGFYMIRCAPFIFNKRKRDRNSDISPVKKQKTGGKKTKKGGKTVKRRRKPNKITKGKRKQKHLKKGGYRHTRKHKMVNNVKSKTKKHKKR